MRRNLLIALFSVILLIVGCKKSEDVKLPEGYHKVEVLEVIQVSQYIYIRFNENNQDIWLAAPKQEAKKGDIFYFSKSMEMQNFKSEELKRTFDKVLFVNDLSAQLPSGSAAKETAPMPQQESAPVNQQPQKPVITKEDVKVEKVKGGVTLAELFARPSAYSGKTITVHGKVVKMNSAIMGRNWVHVQDGTSSGDNFDLTVTTNSLVKVGDVVSFTGKISLDKDFGYGYSYKVLLEDAEAK